MSEARLIAQAGGLYRLEGVLDFATVTSVCRAGSALLKPRADIAFDLSGVGSANSAGLALLVEWLDIARARGVRLTYRNLPDALVRIAAVSNLSALLCASVSDGGSREEGSAAPEPSG